MTRPENLEQLLDNLAALAADNGRVSLGMIVESVGSRSFGPMLMLIGLILFSPLSGLPGMASLMAVVILLVALQMMLGRRRFWLPRLLLNRSVARQQLHRAIKRARKPARGIDRVLKPRLVFLVQRAGSYGVAVVCVLLSLVMPLMELVPFSASAAGLALLVLGLGLMVQDGLLVLFALAVLGSAFALVASNFLA